MTKSEFFKMLDNHLESHNYTFDHIGNRIKRQDRQYTANEIEPSHIASQKRRS